MMDVRVEIRNFIQNDLANNRNGLQFNDDTELIQSGVIDSLGIMKLLAFLENEFSITIGGDDLTPENFQTVEKISRLVKKLTAQTEALNEL